MSVQLSQYSSEEISMYPGFSLVRRACGQAAHGAARPARASATTTAPAWPFSRERAT